MTRVIWIEVADFRCFPNTQILTMWECLFPLQGNLHILWMLKAVKHGNNSKIFTKTLHLLCLVVLQFFLISKSKLGHVKSMKMFTTESKVAHSAL